MGRKRKKREKRNKGKKKEKKRKENPPPTHTHRKIRGPRSWWYLFVVLISPVMFTSSSLVYAHSKQLLLHSTNTPTLLFLELGRKNSHSMVSAAPGAVLRHFDSSHNPLLLHHFPLSATIPKPQFITTLPNMSVMQRSFGAITICAPLVVFLVAFFHIPLVPFFIIVYRVSQEECARLRENVP